MKPGEDNSEYFAVIDLGSNSFHLVVAQWVDDHFRIVDRMKEPVRLAGGLDKQQLLSDQKQEEAIDCLRRFGQRLQGFRPEQVKIVGTNTLRKAKNLVNWLDAAEATVGFPIDIISGLEEARLVYLGVRSSIPNDDKKRLVVDIGGGSTELIIGKGNDTLLLDSLFMGCVGITSSFFPDGVISEKRWQRAVLAARMELEPVEVHYRHNWDQVIGSSGTIKTVGTIVQAQGWSDEGIRFDSLKKLRDRVLSFPDIKTLALTGLSEERRSVFLGGLAILYAVFEALDIQQMFVSETALREGSLVDLLGRHEHKDVRVDTVNRLKGRYKIDTTQADRVTNSALKLLGQVANEWELDDPRFGSYLCWAAQTHEIGLAISHSQYHKHSAYLVQYSDMPGFSNREQQILSMLVRSHRRKFSSNPFDELPVSYVKKVKRLAFLFRLAVLLNRGRQNRDHPDCKLSIARNEIGIWFPPGWLQENKMVEGDLCLEKSFLGAAGFKLSYQ